MVYFCEYIYKINIKQKNTCNWLQAVSTKKKSSISTALSGKRGIRTPGTVARTPHFECGPIDHSGIFPMRFAGANVRIYFLIPTIYLNILHFFCEKLILKYLFTNIIIIFVMYYIRLFTRLTYK